MKVSRSMMATITTMRRFFFHPYRGRTLGFAVILLLVLQSIGSDGSDNSRSSSNNNKDLYVLLGVGSHASTKEIKSAYRRKALDTHPDKNKDVPPEKAAEAFRQVVHAFEILSDPTSRRRYDQTGRKYASTRTSNDEDDQQEQRDRTPWNWNSNQKASKELKDKFEVQQAQSRVLHVVSLEQLKTVILDENGILERNLLLCFVHTDRTEEMANDNLLFPYPFAGMSPQGVWWEDILQTVMVRFDDLSEDLPRAFGVTETIKQAGSPMLVFGKRGQSLKKDAKDFARHYTFNRARFEKWVWKQIQVDLHFHNQHQYPVEIYQVHGTNATMVKILPAGAKANYTSFLSHEWVVRDARVDTHKNAPPRNQLSGATRLASWTITSDTSPQTMVIPDRQCYDLSGYCNEWAQKGACNSHRNFMRKYCRFTCNVCSYARDMQRIAELQEQQEQNNAREEL